MAEQVKAPWTDEQVASLNGFQQGGVWHPFTCGGRPSGRDCRAVLVATPAGWSCPDNCGYTQDWAWDFMADGTWRTAKEEFDRLFAQSAPPPTIVAYAGETSEAVHSFTKSLSQPHPEMPLTTVGCYPEFDYRNLCPFHPTEVVRNVAGLVAEFYANAMSKTDSPQRLVILTLSEVVLRTLSNLTRNKMLVGASVEFVWIDKDGVEISLPLTDKGDTIGPWPDSMFETTFNLLFHGVPELPSDAIEKFIKGRQAARKRSDS